MSRKSRGINAERELVHMFWQSDWAAVRVAASGANAYPSADIIAGNGTRLLVIECKLTKEKVKYISKQQIKELKQLAEKLNAEPWIGIKLPRKQWLFFPIVQLKEKDKSYLVNFDDGLTFKELITFLF